MCLPRLEVVAERGEEGATRRETPRNIDLCRVIVREIIYSYGEGHTLFVACREVDAREKVAFVLEVGILPRRLIQFAERDAASSTEGIGSGQMTGASCISLVGE